MDDLDFDEFQDICGLGEIFPDIEPYLKDMTTTFENAKAESVKQMSEKHIDGSDSDSGISGDSFATVNKQHDERSNQLSGINLTDHFVFENFVDSESGTCNNKSSMQTTTPILVNSERPILNIIRKTNDTNVVRPKQIVIKSHQPATTLIDNFKRESGNILPKVTKVRILKNNDGYPIILNGSKQSYSIKNENKSYCEYTETNLKEIDEPYHQIPNNIATKDSVSNKVSMKSFNKHVFLSEIPLSPVNIDNSKLQNDIYESRPLSFEMSEMGDFQSMECSESYYDMFQSSPTAGTNILSSSTYGGFSNCNGIINTQQFDRIIKKQERMIKNRQAASLSRQRKKEYVERLEHKSELQKLENQHLQNQVIEIKERFCALEQENQIIKRDLQMWRDRYYDLERQKIKQGIPVTSKHQIPKTIDITNKSRALKTTAASTTVLGIFILLTFNFNSWADINQRVSLLYTAQRERHIPIFSNSDNADTSSMGQKAIGSASRIGRTLFSVMENISLSHNSLSKDVANSKCNNASGLNLTETARLTIELNKWGSRYNAESVKEYDRIHNEKIKSQILNKEINSIYKRSKLRYYRIPNDKLKGFNSAELEIYQRNSGYNFLDTFFNDIDQKPDTLYFVSFHSDNLIYPATASNNNNFSIPKITLLLPADVRQEDETYYKMMKIDCNVHNFTVVNLRKMKQP